MPKSALPEHLQDIEHNFPDDEQFGTTTWYGRLYRWFNKTTKTWFAFSYRCPEEWAQWRKIPLVLFAVRGKGCWRWEHSDNHSEVYDFSERIINDRTLGKSSYYLSRCQYYSRWHFAIQWPLMISFHFYFKASDVPDPLKFRPDLDGKALIFYWNHFDADLVYWMLTSFYLGTNFK